MEYSRTPPVGLLLWEPPGPVVAAPDLDWCFIVRCRIGGVLGWQSLLLAGVGGAMCGRCAPHGGRSRLCGCAGDRQQDSRLPAGPARLKRGLGGSCNVHRRSEEPAPSEEQDRQYTSGQKEFLEPWVLSGFFAPFWPTKKGLAAGGAEQPIKAPAWQMPKKPRHGRAKTKGAATPPQSPSPGSSPGGPPGRAPGWRKSPAWSARR